MWIKTLLWNLFFSVYIHDAVDTNNRLEEREDMTQHICVCHMYTDVTLANTRLWTPVIKTYGSVTFLVD